MKTFSIVILVLFVFLLMFCTSESNEKNSINVIIHLKADSTLVVNDKNYTLDNLDSLLESYDTKIVVAIKPDTSVSMGLINEIHQVLRSLDITKISHNDNLN